MMQEHERRSFLCERLQRLGYAPQRRIKLYGEEFELISAPAPEGRGYVVQGISRKSGNVRHLHIPLSTVQTIERELLVMEQITLAA